MAIVWQTTFDGSDSTAVTVANSGDHGDALAAVSGTVVYDTSWAADGTASILVGGPGVSGFSGYNLPTLHTGDLGTRMYLRVQPASSLDVQFATADGGFFYMTAHGDGVLDHSGGGPIVLPTDGSPFRLDVAITAATGDYSIYVYTSDPDSLAPDDTLTGTMGNLPSGAWSGYVEDYANDGLNIDAVVVTDTAEAPGPATGTITVDNTLHGTAGAAVTDSTLSPSARTGTVTVVHADNTGTGLAPQAEYSGDQQVLTGDNTVRLWQCNHRFGTTRADGLSAGPQPQIQFSLPSAPWAVRFYAYFPAGWNTWNTQYGDLFNERCWLVRLGDYGLTIHETSGGNIGFRMQPPDVTVTPDAPSLSGTAHALNGQMIRVEITCDGTDTTVYTYVGQDTTTPRIAAFTGVAPSADDNQLTGYPFTFDSYLPYGNTSFDQRVADYQNKLIDQEYPAPDWGADGFYGDEMAGQWDSYAADVGLDFLVGTFGSGGGAPPDIIRAIDVDRSDARLNQASLPTSVYVGYLAAAEGAVQLGPAEADEDGVVHARGGIVLGGSATASRRAIPHAQGGIAVGGQATVSRHARVSASGGIALGGHAKVSKHARPHARGGIVLGGSADTQQGTTLFIDYSAGHLTPPLEPIDDDQHIRNDVTVKRDGGSSARHVVTEGPLSIQAPPEGVGRYDTSVTLNVFRDDQLAQLAAWRAHLGTVDRLRYPKVTVDLTNKDFLVADVTSRDSGDWLRIINPPPWLPPEDIDLLIQGYTETIGLVTWKLTFNASDATAYTVGEVYAPATIGGPDRADTSGSRVWGDITETQTSFDVEVDEGSPFWVDSATYPDEFPFDIVCGGEAMTVTAIAAPFGFLQEFTVQRSVNGISKAHPDDAAVQLAEPAVVAL